MSPDKKRELLEALERLDLNPDFETMITLLPAYTTESKMQSKYGASATSAPLNATEFDCLLFLLAGIYLKRNGGK